MINNCILKKKLDYTEIFNDRGKSYELAMREYPVARAQEFNNIINLANLDNNLTVCDVPSGGGYLSNFIKQNIKLISIDTSEVFHQLLIPKERSQVIHTPNLSKIPVLSNSVDRIISLAGLHHVEDRLAFYQEAYRLLKNDGKFCIADVQTGTGVADFLNIFVDRYSSTRHQGDFLTIRDRKQLEQAGFVVSYTEQIDYHWLFDSVEQMTDYCRKLFGMDRATNIEVLDGIEKYLGYELTEDKCLMNWGLYFLKALKPL